MIVSTMANKDKKISTGEKYFRSQILRRCRTNINDFFMNLKSLKLFDKLK